MKYVRIKSGVYKIIHTCLNGDYLIDEEDCNGLPEGVVKKDIIKEADDIEDLCDNFVFESDDITPLICDSYDELIYWFNHSKEEQYTTRNCYGAIWTDKGLIYVAKLNEKGELELI